MPFDALAMRIEKKKDLLEGVTAFYTLAILRTQHASLQVYTHTHTNTHPQQASPEARAEVLKSQCPSMFYSTEPRVS